LLIIRVMTVTGLEKHFKYRPYKARKVLLVDDEEDLGWILNKIIRDAGHRLIYASTLTEGIRKLKNSKKLDMAIIDLRLGNDSGLTFIKKAKTINCKVKLTVISAFGTDEIKNKARRLGVRHFLDKPVKPEKLLDIIDRDCF